MSEWFVCVDKTKCGVNMAKMWLEDGSIMSSSKIADIANQTNGGDTHMAFKNRDYIHNLCDYDLLCKVQKEIYSGERCIIKAITGMERKCHKVERDGFSFRDCNQCIANWLGENKS